MWERERRLKMHIHTFRIVWIINADTWIRPESRAPTIKYQHNVHSHDLHNEKRTNYDFHRMYFFLSFFHCWCEPKGWYITCGWSRSNHKTNWSNDSQFDLIAASMRVAMDNRSFWMHKHTRISSILSVSLSLSELFLIPLFTLERSKLSVPIWLQQQQVSLKNKCISFNIIWKEEINCPVYYRQRFL